MAAESGKLGAVYLATDTNVLADEALTEVDLTSQGYAPHTVYEITGVKRYMVPGSTPVFQFDTGGDHNYVAVTPYKTEMCGCRIFLSTARGATDVGRVHSGNYMTLAMLAGMLNWKVNDGKKFDEVMIMGADCPKNYPVYKNWSADIESLIVGTQATRTIGNITLTHEPGGVGGNSIYTTVVDPGAGDNALSIAVTALEIVINLETDDGDLVTTEAELLEALDSSLAVRNLGVVATMTGDGSPVVAAQAHTHLLGGLDASSYTSDSTLVVVLYSNTVTHRRREGYGKITNWDPDSDPTKVNRQKITINADNCELYFR